ncbi:MAG: hypothetical protein DMD99_06390 [Candidatus Rokuibacteriota bacterium]|nr:MAG: hypothetical protein DMD99_06390 [Candidatus Rokubacteria bacterium]
MTRESLALDPWPITASPDNFVIVVAGGGHPTNSYWLQGYSPGVVGRPIERPSSFERLLADAEHDLGPRETGVQDRTVPLRVTAIELRIRPVSAAPWSSTRRRAPG